MPQDYKSHLNPEQLKAAEAMGTVCVIAGAGTGKTSTLTAAIIDKMRAHNIKPSRIFATTFTKKASAEMAERLIKFNADVPRFLGTFHSNARKLMSIIPALAGGIDVKKLDILDPDMANAFVTKHVLNRISEDDLEEARDLASKGNFRPDGLSLAALSTKFLDIASIMKMESTSQEDLAEKPRSAFSRLFQSKTYDNPAGEFLAARFFDRYNNKLKEHNSMDFDDLISVPTVVMRNDPKLQKRASSLFDAVFIDEDQDTNLIQAEFASYITQTAKVVFRVGDDGQAIYGWRGSCVSILREFKKTADTTVVLHRNYRSTQNILDFGSNILTYDRESDNKSLTASNNKITSKEALPITTIDCGEEHKIWDEANVIAAIIEERVRSGESPSRFAIVTRTNYVATVCYYKLVNRGIPAICDADDIFKLKIIRFLIAYAIAAAYPDDSVNALRIDDLFSNPYMPNMKMGEKTRDKLQTLILQEGGIIPAVRVFKETTTLRYRKHADEALTTLVNFIKQVQQKEKVNGELPALAVFQQAYEISGLHKELDYKTSTLRKSLAKLQQSRFPNRREEDKLTKELESIDNAKSHVNGLLDLVAGVGVREAIEMIMLAKEAKKDDGTPRVRVTTIHKAKGLEWDVVIFPAATRSVFFSAHENSPEYYEGVRCLYVAATRPRHELIITHSEYPLVPVMQAALGDLPHNDLVLQYGSVKTREEAEEELAHSHDEYEYEEDEEEDYL